MFITPIIPINSIEELKPVGKSAGSSEAGVNAFGEILNQAISDVVSTEKNLADKQYLQSTGQIDDAHTVPIAAAEAQMSVNLLVQIRNKALESYNELIRLSV